MRYRHSQPKVGKIIMGKLNEKKNNKKWRSITAHDKEAHSNKIIDQRRLLLLTEVKTKEYRHSECMEKYKLH